MRHQRPSRPLAAGNRRPTCRWKNPTVLVDGWCQQFSSHSGGDLRFATGRDALCECRRGSELQLRRLWPDRQSVRDPVHEGGALRAQDIRSTSDPLGYSGAVIRINPDGGTPAIVAYGFRNPFRFAVRPGTSELWVGDVGWTAWEELDRIAAPDSASPAELRLAVLRGRRAPEQLRRPEQAAVRDPVRAGRHGVGAAVLDVQPRQRRRPVLRRHARRSRASPSPPRAAATRPPTRAGSSSRTTRATASGTCRAGATGCPTRRAWPRSRTAACTRSSSLAPDGNLLYVDINDGSVVRITHDRPWRWRPRRRPPARPRSPSSSTARPRPGARARLRLGSRRRRPVRRCHGRAPFGHLRGRDLQRAPAGDRCPPGSRLSRRR